MKLWAIKQISTGLFLPAGGKGLGGHTKQEPCSDRAPRIFTLERVAASAMRAYVAGQWREWNGINSYSGEWEYDGPEPARGTQRDKDDFTVVPITLKVL